MSPMIEKGQYESAKKWADGLKDQLEKEIKEMDADPIADEDISDE